MFAYSGPLIVLSLVGVFAGLFDRWVLQNYGGAAEQGYYGLAAMIGSGCLLFAAAMTPLLLREFAIAWDVNDLSRMKYLFERFVPLMYSITSYFCCFIFIRADDVVWLFGGNSFQDGALVVALLAFAPMHQTYGQLSSSIPIAIGRTVEYRNIGLGSIAIGIPLTWILIAPGTIGGKELGAAGLAIKTVGLQFLTVNIQLWLNSRLLGLNFRKLLAQQMLVPIIFSLCADVVSRLVGSIELGRLAGFLAAGCVYTLAVLICFIALPRTFGLERQDIDRMRKRVAHYVSV